MTEPGNIMIGWRADYGYFNNIAAQKPGTPSNLSDITWVDKNRVFTIPTLSSELVSLMSPYTKGWNDRELARQAVEDAFGKDYYAIYCTVGDFVGASNPIDNSYTVLLPSSKQRMEWSIPSFNLGAPGMFKTPSGEYGKSYAIYVKSLSVLITGSENWSYIYKVGSNGELTDRASGFPSFRAGSVSFSQYWFSINSGVIVDYDPNNVVVGSWLYQDTGNLDSTKTVNILDINSSGKFNLSQYVGKEIVPDFEGDIPTDNPYEPGGPSGEGGGGGTFDGDSDQIDDSPLPTLSSADTGFTRIYSPTLEQVKSLAQYLWTDDSLLQTLWNHIKQYFENPMEAFISFSVVPVNVPISGTDNFKVLFFPTNVELNAVANQFVDVDCGTFELKEYYGSALDYSPYTKISLYLPFIGTVSLNTDDVMGRTLQIKYRVDICSGTCVAKVFVDGNVIYQFPGSCSTPIPITSADFSTYASAIITAAKTAIGVAAGALGGPAGMALGTALVGATPAQQTSRTINWQYTETERNPTTGRQITSGTQNARREENTTTEASFAGLLQEGISNTVGAVEGSKTIIERSGSFSGNSGYLGVRYPYLIIQRPRMCMPENYQSFNGFPSMITIKLSECSGFTRVQQVQLIDVEATNPEQAEIMQFLKGGVYL